MKVWFPTLISAFLLGCSNPAFEFRGYTANSTCNEVVGAEEHLGGHIQSTETIDTQTQRTATSLEVEFLDYPAFAQIECYASGKVVAVYYSIGDNVRESLTGTFDRVAKALATEIGEGIVPTGDFDTDRRMLDFPFPAGGFVRLYEGGTHQEGLYRVHLTVCVDCPLK